jgi:hypothetical protein
LQNVQRILHLYGAVTQAEIVGFLRTQCVFEKEGDLEGVIREWPKAAAKFAELTTSPGDIPEAIKKLEFENEHEDDLAEIERDPLFVNSFSLTPRSFEILEIDKLVAPQRFVNLDHVDRVSSKIPLDVDMTFLINFCLKQGPSPPIPSELQIAPNVYSYKSESADFRFIGGYPKKLTEDDIKNCLGGGFPVAGLLLFVGYGAAAMNVFKIGGRYILNNGFHRAFALRKRRVTHIPVVVQHITNWSLELPQVLIGLPTTYLVTAPRPSLVKDFFNNEISRELSMKSRDRSVQIQWNLSQVDVPK